MDRTTSITQASGSIFWSYDGLAWNEVFFSGSPNASGASYYIDITSGPWPSISGSPDLFISFTTPGAGADVPLAEGEILQWNNVDQKFKPAQLRTAAETRTLLGIGEYVDDSAAGTGGVASGAMYYNTTSSDYRLKS